MGDSGDALGDSGTVRHIGSEALLGWEEERTHTQRTWNVPWLLRGLPSKCLQSRGEMWVFCSDFHIYPDTSLLGTWLWKFSALSLRSVYRRTSFSLKCSCLCMSGSCAPDRTRTTHFPSILAGVRWEGCSLGTEYWVLVLVCSGWCSDPVVFPISRVTYVCVHMLIKLAASFQNKRGGNVWTEELETASRAHSWVIWG